MEWEIGDHGFRMSLSPEVARVVESVLRDAIVDWLAEMDLNLSDIDAWAVHPGGPRIIDAVESDLGLSPDMFLAYYSSQLREHVIADGCIRTGRLLSSESGDKDVDSACSLNGKSLSNSVIRISNN
jgi:hypothetical protein